MKRNIILTMTVLAAGAMSPLAAQTFQLKPHVGIGLGKAVDLESSLPLETMKASSMEYGVDFGYNFWKKGGSTLSANIGIGYRNVSLKLDGYNATYSYAAPADADVDGDTYIRHYDISGMGEKLRAGYVDIPIYLGYDYRVADRFGIYADLGVNLGFKADARVRGVQGSADIWGFYQQYDGLDIDDPYINGFGQVDLAGAGKATPEAKGFMGSLIVGAGVKARIAGPVWVNLGVRYDCGFGDIFRKGIEGKDFTAETAPATYTVAGGERVKAFSDYLSKSHLSALSLNVGLIIDF